MPESYNPELLEKLLPWFNKPVGVHAITALTAGMDKVALAQIKQALQDHWVQSYQPIDHRRITPHTVETFYAGITHYIATSALGEFERLKKVYDQTFTVGMKQTIDAYAQTHESISYVEPTCLVTGWRIDASPICDLRRRNGERILLASKVRLDHRGQQFIAKTANISNGGVLISLDPKLATLLSLQEVVEVAYIELAQQYGLEHPQVAYEVVAIRPAENSTQVALKRLNQDASVEFDQLVAHLMNEHKRRNHLDVDNTMVALRARCYNMASIGQLNALMVLSHCQDRYHLLVSQGQSLGLQAQLQLDPHLIPTMVEQTAIGQSQLFFVWADSQKTVCLVALSSLTHATLLAAILNGWRSAAWYKAFLVKADTLNPQMAELGTSLPCNVAPIVSKLNAPLPVKVARLSQELNKISVLEDVTYVIDRMGLGQVTTNLPSLEKFRLVKAQGILRQVPFKSNELPQFNQTYRFSHDCKLSHNFNDFNVVNGYANAKQAVVSMSLKAHHIAINDKVTVTWVIDGVLISLAAKVIGHDQIAKSITLGWSDVAGLVTHLFDELKRLDAFDLAFKEDIQANKLDFALRNLVLSNLPKVTIFANVQPLAISIAAVTGGQYLPIEFIDQHRRVKLDHLFSAEILLKLSETNQSHQDMLFVALKKSKEGSKVTERHLLSEFKTTSALFKILRQLKSDGELAIFILNIAPPCAVIDDPIVTIERKYLGHYDPSKAKKLDASLSYNLSIQLVEVSGIFGGLIG